MAYLEKSNQMYEKEKWERESPTRGNERRCCTFCGLRGVFFFLMIFFFLLFFIFFAEIHFERIDGALQVATRRRRTGLEYQRRTGGAIGAVSASASASAHHWRRLIDARRRPRFVWHQGRTHRRPSDTSLPATRSALIAIPSFFFFFFFFFFFIIIFIIIFLFFFFFFWFWMCFCFVFRVIRTANEEQLEFFFGWS